LRVLRLGVDSVAEPEPGEHMSRPTPKACKVIFSKDQWSALLVSKPAGYILNAINYDSGYWPSKVQQARDRRKLMRGCVELLNRYF